MICWKLESSLIHETLLLPCTIVPTWDVTFWVDGGVAVRSELILMLKGCKFCQSIHFLHKSEASQKAQPVCKEKQTFIQAFLPQMSLELGSSVSLLHSQFDRSTCCCCSFDSRGWYSAQTSFALIAPWRLSECLQTLAFLYTLGVGMSYELNLHWC